MAYRIDLRYTTRDEIAFLKQLKRKSRTEGKEGGRALEALRNYRRTFNERTQWGKIDKEEVARALAILLSSEG